MGKKYFTLSFDDGLEQDKKSTGAHEKVWPAGNF